MTPHRCIFPVAILAFSLTFSTAVGAQDTALDLMLQVQRLQQWVGASPHADGWRRYLLLNQLETQAVKAWRADPAVIGEILKRFESKKPGLEHPVFAGVRDALRLHSEQLSTSVDIETAMGNARQAYIPVTQERLRGETAVLVSEVELCRKRYQTSLPADQFAALDLTLRLDELRRVAGELDLSPLGDSAAPNKKQLDDLRTLRAIVLLFNEKSMRQRDRFLPVVRRRLERVFFQYTQWLQANAQQEFEEHLAKLQSLLPTLDDPQQRSGQGEFAVELGWLDATGHAPQLVSAIRAKYTQPNIQFAVAETLADSLAARPVQNQRPVDEMILGRRIEGTATTSGQVKIDFVDDPDQAHFSIRMLGSTFSNSHTRQGPITAYSDSYADVEARRSILVNSGGLIEYAPYAAANLSSEFCGVNCIPLVERLAYRQYLKDKSASEAIGARRLEQRLIDQFADESGTAIRQGKERLTQALREKDSPLALAPPLYIRTSNDALFGYGLKSETFQVSASVVPPQVTVPADVVFQAHESLLDNYAEPVFARQTVKSNEFGAKFKEWFGELPEGFVEPSSDELWGITFANTRPIQFIFENNRFGVAILGSKFTRDEEYRDREGNKKTRVKESIDEPMMIKIMFQFVREKDHLLFVRDGRATVDFTRPGVKTVPQNAFRSFLEDVLNKSLREQEDANRKAAEASGKQQTLPANLIPADRLKDPTIAQNLELVTLRSESGWVTAAWRYSPRVPASRGGAQAPRILGPIDVPAIVDAPTVQGPAP